MDRPLVSCQGCSRTWHSRTMAEGLRAVGRCPRCGGALDWSDTVPEPDAEPAASGPPARAGVAPHLVLGIPRR